MAILSEKYPKLVKEWHHTKNGVLKPSDYTTGSKKKIWWKCKKNHKWEATIGSRTRGTGCPYCSNRRVGYRNDLQTRFPDIALQWHPTKNADLKPKDFVAGSYKRIWWIDIYNHEWIASISSRTKGTGCPQCSNQTSGIEVYIYSELEWIFKKVENRKKIQGSEVDIFIKEINLCIEIDGIYWHKNKIDKDRKKNKKLTDLGYDIIRLRDKPLKKISNKDLIVSFTSNRLLIMIDLLTKIKTCSDISKSSSKRLNKWLHDKEQKNMKHYTRILSYLPGPLPEDSLKYKFPKIAQLWNNNRNGELRPSHVTPYSKIKVWWICSKGHEYDAMVQEKTGMQSGCPYCSSKRPGYGNTLAEIFPDISKEWNKIKNGNKTPYDFTSKSQKEVWWKCKKNHEWKARIGNRTSLKSVCPYCDGKKAGYGNDLNTLFPELMKEWNFDKNKELNPKEIKPGTHKKAWWVCSKKHEWVAEIRSRTLRNKTNCPYCANQKIGYGNDFQTMFPDKAKQWHISKNGNLKPEKITPGSHKQAWWQCDKGHEWEIEVRRMNGCPRCKKK